MLTTIGTARVLRLPAMVLALALLPAAGHALDRDRLCQAIGDTPNAAVDRTAKADRQHNEASDRVKEAQEALEAVCGEEADAVVCRELDSLHKRTLQCDQLVE